MSDTIVVQGRQLDPAHLVQIRELIAGNPSWSRRRLSEALCAEWDWRNAAGRAKDMAARSLLNKLQARGLIELPPLRQRASNRMRSHQIPVQHWDLRPIVGSLRQVGPLSLQEVSADPAERVRFGAALAQFHYLGYRGTVGENLQYTLTDASGRLLACLLFGSPAWKCRARDEFIGWTSQQRQQRLELVTNNTRFLILPFVQVEHLASWTLGRVLRRLSQDWQRKYGHAIVLVETFVERERFAGTSYKAANWRCLGATSGRSRQDRHHQLRVPLKDLYLYALRRNLREVLSA
jgi:transposase